MYSKHLGWICSLAASSLALAGCGAQTAQEGSNFYVEACSLGCSNGNSGVQVSCGVVGVAENQEIALLFSSAVNLQTITKESFQVKHSITGAAAAGTRFIDPLNPRRLVFRPKLTVGSTGNSIFGFEKDASYEIQINGTAQNDPVPFIENTGGRRNEARVKCTISANQGIVDPIPGKPRGRLEVDTVDPITGAITRVQVAEGQVPGAINVLTASAATFTFDELMDISTLVNPSEKTSPTISVLVDIDGDLLTTQDRADIAGEFVYGLDQIAQTTTVEFTPTNGFPSQGNDPDNPRLVVLSVNGNVSDIASNTLENPGVYSFAAQTLAFPEVTIPPTGEQFANEDNLDTEVSGADWGTAVDDLTALTPGEGGGSGRLGRLHIGIGETVVLHSTQGTAAATMTFLFNPVDGDVVELANVSFTFRDSPSMDLADHEIATRHSIPYSASTFADTLNAFVEFDGSSPVSVAKFSQVAYDTVLIEAMTPGPLGQPYGLGAFPVAGPEFASFSSSSLEGEVEFDAFASPGTLTNFDFDADFGGIPPDSMVTDGVYEFSDVLIEATGRLLLVGDKEVQLLARGDFTLEDQAIIDLSGETPGPHKSFTPYGQTGGRGGVGGGDGGHGGNRFSVPAMNDSDLLGITISAPPISVDGAEGEGVGGVPVDEGGVGQGLGGVHWPLKFPTESMVYNQYAVDNDCFSQQMGATGSGAAYALDGEDGLAMAAEPIGTNSMDNPARNLPDDQTLGASAAAVDLEPASDTPIMERLLTPVLGYLRGGAGGGGGGAHLTGIRSGVFAGLCFTEIDDFLDNSAASGGGGGGALQIQVGRQARLFGEVDASGGDGGSSDAVFSEGTYAAPGGGAAGGAFLLQAGELDLSTSPSRILINGGSGGTGGTPVSPSIGGAGSPGLVRVEQRGRGNGPPATEVAAITFPTDPGDDTSVNWLSTGDWIYDDDKVTLAEALSGSQSCWMQPPGSHFSLTFQGDEAGADPSEMGWNMDVILDTGSDIETVPFRGDDGNGFFDGFYPEEHWNRFLYHDLPGGETPAPIVVRFQGAATKTTILDPCDVDLVSGTGPIKIGSLSPWVNHPRQLNPYVPLPTAVRFVILFNRSHEDFQGEGMEGITILGVTNLRIRAQPE